MRRRWAPDFMIHDMGDALARFCGRLGNLTWARSNPARQYNFKYLSGLLMSIYQAKVCKIRNT